MLTFIHSRAAAGTSTMRSWMDSCAMSAEGPGMHALSAALRQHLWAASLCRPMRLRCHRLWWDWKMLLMCFTRSEPPCSSFSSEPLILHILPALLSCAAYSLTMFHHCCGCKQLRTHCSTSLPSFAWEAHARLMHLSALLSGALKDTTNHALQSRQFL